MGCAANPAAGVELQSKRGPGEANAISLVLAVLATGGRPPERREFVRTHRTCVFGYRRKNDGPGMSVVYYIPTDDDELLVSTMAGRGKARVIARDKVSLCVLDERWPFAYLQVYADAVIEDDPELVVDVMMAVAGRMSGQPLL